MVNNKKSLPDTPAEQAILTTILYSDIFSFPLKKDELWSFLISSRKVTWQAFDVGLHALKRQIIYQDGFFCLSGRKKIIMQRKKNLAEVARKMLQVRLVAEKLAVIPSILFIGISGGLAVGNATKDDDIDLVIILKKNTLFSSRLLILYLLEMLGVRRFRTQKDTADTICVNLLFDETALTWFVNQQDVYTAREIAQIIPLFERDALYQRFITANMWIKHFLPNFDYLSHSLLSPVRKKSYSAPYFYRNKDIIITFLSLGLIHPFFEKLFRFLQTSLMRRHQTKEIISNHLLALHPNDYRTYALTQLRLKMRQFGLLTKF